MEACLAEILISDFVSGTRLVLSFLCLPRIRAASLVDPADVFNQGVPRAKGYRPLDLDDWVLVPGLGRNVKVFHAH